MFIYRDDYYNKESKEPGVAEIVIGKQRNGPVGTVKLAFMKPLTKFRESGARQLRRRILTGIRTDTHEKRGLVAPSALWKHSGSVVAAEADAEEHQQVLEHVVEV